MLLNSRKLAVIGSNKRGEKFDGGSKTDRIREGHLVNGLQAGSLINNTIGNLPNNCNRQGENILPQFVHAGIGLLGSEAVDYFHNE